LKSEILKKQQLTITACLSYALGVTLVATSFATLTYISTYSHVSPTNPMILPVLPYEQHFIYLFSSGIVLLICGLVLFWNITHVSGVIALSGLSLFINGLVVSTIAFGNSQRSGVTLDLSFWIGVFSVLLGFLLLVVGLIYLRRARWR
jgi:uncharacterized membrane protein HdeD (DUF308 family)